MAQKKYARRRPKPRVAGFAQDGSRLRLKPPPRSVRVRRLLSAPVRWVDWKAVGTGSATLVAVCTVVVAVATFFVSTQTLKANTREQASERFVRAIDQLGSDKTDVRLGGIYGLEQLARDSPSDQPAVFDVLSTYVREHAPSHSVKCDPDAAEFAREPDKSPNPGEDVLAVVQAIARRDARYDRAGQKISLVHTCLKYAKFSNLQLAGIELASADLGYTSFESANLARAALDGADVSDSWLVNADLQSATLSYCNFHASNLGGANLSNAVLRGADMRGVSMTKVTTPPDPDNNGKQLTVGPANLTHADLQSADLSGATLRGVNFSSADLSDANLTDASLDDATFAGVHYNDATRWPAGFRPPPNKP